MERSQFAEHIWVFVGLGSLVSLAVILFLFASPTLPERAPMREGRHSHRDMSLMKQENRRRHPSADQMPKPLWDLRRRIALVTFADAVNQQETPNGNKRVSSRI